MVLTGCSDAQLVGPNGQPFVELSVWPDEPTVFVGDSCVFAARGVTANGDTALVDVTWSATGGDVERVAEGRAVYKPNAAGHFTITAIADSLADSTMVTVTAAVPPPPPPPLPGGAADPTLLPEATGAGMVAGFEYGRDLKAGESYVDPRSGVVVYKITDGNTPGASERAHPTYAETGPSISLPWGDGSWYTIFYMTRQSSGKPANQWWFVDFNIVTGEFTNRRLAPENAEENTWGFSFNPATPRIGYHGRGAITRYDTEAMAEANTGLFPKDLGLNRGSVLHFDANDEWFVTQEFQKEAPTVFWNSRTDEVWTSQYASTQPRIDRNGAYGFPAYDPTVDGVKSSATKRLNLVTGAEDEPFYVWQTHPASMRGYLMTSNPRTSGGNQVQFFDPAVPELVLLGSPGEIQHGSGHWAGQWVHGNRAGREQWCLFSGWGGAGKMRDGIYFVPLNYPTESVRLLANHSSDPGSDYYAQPHANISPDGRLVMWGSNQGGSRIDAFVAIVPAR